MENGGAAGKNLGQGHKVANMATLPCTLVVRCANVGAVDKHKLHPISHTKLLGCSSRLIQPR